jgi:hypothetical protein
MGLCHPGVFAVRPHTLTDFTSPHRISGTQLNFQQCPTCGSDNWHVYVDPVTGGWFCFAGQHHGGGFVDVGLDAEAPGAHLLRLIDPESGDLEWSETELPTHHPPSEPAVLYLKNRGFSDLEITQAGFQEWMDEYRLILPYFEAGNCIFWTSRRYSDYLGQGPPYWSQPGKKPAYIPPFCFGAPHEKWDKLVLVEGVFDALAVQRAGYRALGLGGKTLVPHILKKILTLAQDCGIIYVFLDQDALVDALEIWQTLVTRTEKHVRIVCVPRNQDPGNMSPEEIESCFRS